MATRNDTSPSPIHRDRDNGLAGLVDAYASELAERRELLLADRADYARKLDELARHDPHDFSGLSRLYRQHLQHIDGLLVTFEVAA